MHNLKIYETGFTKSIKFHVYNTISAIYNEKNKCSASLKCHFKLLEQYVQYSLHINNSGNVSFFQNGNCRTEKSEKSGRSPCNSIYIKIFVQIGFFQKVINLNFPPIIFSLLFENPLIAHK